MHAPFRRDSREQNLSRLAAEEFDVLILGGGINGAGVARDLCLRARQNGRPLKVALADKGHFSSGTSGKNSQLIHGGLRYLKYFEIRLVREALHERATLLKIAPHLVTPQPFLLPFFSTFDRLFYGAGLALYDLLAGAYKIGRHRHIGPRQIGAREPGFTRKGLTGGAIFYDCQVHSARLTLENIFEAAQNGCVAVNHTAIEPGSALTAVDQLSGHRFPVRAKQLVDATGAWARGSSLRLVRGSHIVLRRVTAGEDAIAYFEPGGRIVFLIPWGEHKELTLVGTTDVDHTASPDQVHISPAEIEYLSGIVRKLYPAADREVISTYSSLRPLVRDESSSATKTSREHRIWRAEDGVIRIAGGKYTTYRAMSQEASELVCAAVAPELAGKCRTAVTPLPRTRPPRSPAEAAEREMARHLADYLFVSTYRGYAQRWTPRELEPLAAEMGEALGWSRQEMAAEVEQLFEQLQPA